jgi:hypothetical protein
MAALRYLLAAIFLTSLALQLVPASAATQPNPVVIGGTGVFVPTGPPQVCSVDISSCIHETYRNTLNFTVTGIVFLVVHNAIGQTVSYSASTIVVAGNQTGTAYNVVYGVPHGAYSGTIFVTSTGGASISAPTVLNFTL